MRRLIVAAVVATSLLAVVTLSLRTTEPPTDAQDYVLVLRDIDVSATLPPIDGLGALRVDDIVIEDIALGVPEEPDDDAVSRVEPGLSLDAPFEHPAIDQRIGGSARPWKIWSRRGRRRNLRAGGGGRRTHAAVELGLDWLHRHQSPDGSWSPAEFETQCRLNRCGGAGDAPGGPGTTGLVLMTFLQAGETHDHGDYAKTVERGLRYLKRVQSADGCFGPRTSSTLLHDHMWATLAMCEAYGLSGSRLFHRSAQRAVDFVLRAQTPGFGWGPSGRNEDDDTSTTILGAYVVRSAILAELEVDRGAFQSAVAWLDGVTDAETGRVGNRQRGDCDLAWHFPTLRGDALTAGSILVRVFAGVDPRNDELVRKGADLLVANPPDAAEPLDPGELALRYFGTQALFQVGAKHWKQWNDALKPTIVDSQHTEPNRDECGSWDPLDPHSAEAGRIHATALHVLCLEVYYRYGRVGKFPP